MEAAMAAGEAIETEASGPDELDELTQTLKALSEGPPDEEASELSQTLKALSEGPPEEQASELTQTLKALSEGSPEEHVSLQQFSHDVRSPLSSVKGCLQLLVRRWDRMDDDRRRLLVETAARETDRVVNIIARLDETRPAG
jgi:nitrogen-specific signal transduction histidine kinase